MPVNETLISSGVMFGALTVLWDVQFDAARPKLLPTSRIHPATSSNFTEMSRLELRIRDLFLKTQDYQKYDADYFKD